MDRKKPKRQNFGCYPAFLDPPPPSPNRGIRIMGTVAMGMAIAVALLRILGRWAG